MPASFERQNRPVIGAILLTLSALLFALMGVGIREISEQVNNETVVFFRNLVGVVFFLPLLLAKGTRPFRTQHIGGHLWRTGYGLAAMYCFFHAIATLPLADAMLFTYSAPVFAPFIARWLLKEPLRRITIILSLVGLIGVLLVAKPSSSVFDINSLYGMGASILAAFAFVSIRQMSDTEPAYRIVFYFALFSALGSAVPFAWTWQPFGLHELYWLLGVGLLATISQIIMSKAYSYASPGLISPFAYMSIIFAGVIGWVLWNEKPDITSIIGAVLIFGSSLLSLLISTKRLRF